MAIEVFTLGLHCTLQAFTMFLPPFLTEKQLSRYKFRPVLLYSGTSS